MDLFDGIHSILMMNLYKDFVRKEGMGFLQRD